MEALLAIVRKKIADGTVTVSELAVSCGVTKAYIYKLLREKSHPTVPVAERMANAVGAELLVKTRSKKKLSA
jgi:DNA-binding phage protein